jgi:hypothetical protein
LMALKEADDGLHGGSFVWYCMPALLHQLLVVCVVLLK